MSRVFAEPNAHWRDEWQSWDLIKFFMIGVDGSRWNFGAPDSPVRLNRPPTGLNGAPMAHDYQPLTGLDGAVYRGTQDEQIPIGLQVWVADARSQAWARRSHSDWRKAFGRGKDTVRIYAITKESGYWWIDARVQSVSEVNWFDQQPGLVGESGELVTLITDRSYFSSFEVEAVTDKPVSYGPNYKTWELELPNPGDQDLWPKFEISGGFSSVTIGIGNEATGEYQTIPSTVTAITTKTSNGETVLTRINAKYTELALAIQEVANELYDGEQPIPDPEALDPEAPESEAPESPEPETPKDAEFRKKVDELRAKYMAEIQDIVRGIYSRGERTVELSNLTTFIDTDPLWPSMVTDTGMDLTQYLPNVRWPNPVPKLASRSEQMIRITATNPTSTFKVSVKGSPRSEMPW